jgi:hypothetical protein
MEPELRQGDVHKPSMSEGNQGGELRASVCPRKHCAVWQAYRRMGPPVWIWGDCHAANLGPSAAPDGTIHVQIRDLNQTVIGNPSHNLVRLAYRSSPAPRKH